MPNVPEIDGGEVLMHPEERPSTALVAAAGIASAVYFAFAAEFAVRVASSSVNPSAKTSLFGILLTTVVFYAVAVAVAYSERRRAAAPVPVLVASLFGIFLLLLW